MRKQFGPLTIGTLFGAGIGLLDAMPALQAIRQGASQASVGSVMLLPLGFACLGGALGFFAEQLQRHAAFADNPWVRHFIRPVLFCTVPYLLVAFVLWHFGDARLLGGLGFWLCVVILPALGFQIAWRRAPRSA